MMIMSHKFLENKCVAVRNVASLVINRQCYKSLKVLQSTRINFSFEINIKPSLSIQNYNGINEFKFETIHSNDRYANFCISYSDNNFNYTLQNTLKIEQNILGALLIYSQHKKLLARKYFLVPSSFYFTNNFQLCLCFFATNTMDCLINL